MWDNSNKAMRRYERGESSRKMATPNDENERPLKKARYVWQLKGKYHLKEQYKCTNTEESPSRSVANEERRDVKEKGKRPNCDGDSNKNCCITSSISTLLARSKTILENESLIEQENILHNMDQSIYDDIPVSMVRPKRDNQDEFLQKWQARQVAKSFIENTINTILEQWKLAPADATEFVENCDNGQVEDEGIMMAIQSHGLQSNTSRYSARTHTGSMSSITSDNPSTNNYIQESSENYRNKRFEYSDGGNADLMTDGDKSMSGNETDQTEFLSTAVTMAIQNKGLSSYSYG